MFRCRYSVTEYIHVTSNPDVEDVMMVNRHRTQRSRPRHNLQQCGFLLLLGKYISVFAFPARTADTACTDLHNDIGLMLMVPPITR